MMPSAIRLAVAMALIFTACTGSGGTSTTSSTVESPADPSVASTTTTTAPPASTTTSTTEPPTPVTHTLPPPVPTTQPIQPEYGGTVVFGSDQEPPTLNPYVPGGDNQIVRTIAEAIYAGAYDIDPVTYELKPDVVTVLPTVANGRVTVNEDGTMTVSYRTRIDAQWADGTPITGNDFRFTYEKLIEVDALGPYDEIIPGSVEVDGGTFTFTMERPTLAHQTMFPVLVPEHQVAGTDFRTDWNDRAWLSAGPFVFDSWDKGKQIVLVRNDNYWRRDRIFNTPLPYLDGVVIRFFPRQEELIGRYLAGEFDVARLSDRADLSRLREAGEDVLHVSGPIWEHLNFQFGVNNPNEDTLNDHLEFRRAVAHAIDRVALAGLGIHRSTGSVLGSYVDAYQPDNGRVGWRRYDHRPAKARRLLTELCERLGRDCEAQPPAVEILVRNSERLRVAEALVPMLQEVGINATIRDDSGMVFFGDNLLDAGSWDMTQWAWIGGPGLGNLVDIHDMFDPAGPPPLGSNYYRWGTPEVTDGSQDEAHVQAKSRLIDEHSVRFAELVRAMDDTLDERRLDRLIFQAERILVDQVIIIPLFRRGHFALARSTVVGGVVANPLETGLLWNVAQWHRVDGQR